MDIDQPTVEFAMKALHHAFSLIEKGDTIQPFLITDEGGEPQLKVLVNSAPNATGSPADVAKQVIAADCPGAVKYALGIEAKLTVDGTPKDAVIIEFGSTEEEKGHQLMQLYKPDGNGQELELDGAPTYIGERPSLLK